MIKADEAWAAVLRRDRAFDDRFVTGVLSTGIYCRPSCPARHPARRNVRFFADGAEARAAGLRPCKRCLPDEAARDIAAVMAAVDAIRRSEEPLALATLAEKAGYSPSHFQRLFTRHLGLSPAAYARALRDDRARDALSSAERVIDAAFEAGYGAASRFYKAMEGRLGMAASVWRKGGEGVTLRWARVETRLGAMLVAASDEGICRLAFGEDSDDLATRFPKARIEPADPALEAMVRTIIASIDQPRLPADLPLDLGGTAFQQAVWAALERIPPGETRSYAQIAAEIGKPGAVRAVGSACGANPVAVLVPCHRALRSDGSLGGYAYGLKIKQALLDQERASAAPRQD